MSKSLSDLLNDFKGDANAFKDLLEAYQLMPIFGNLYAIYQPFEARKAVLYIVGTYTVNTPHMLANELIHLTKQRVAEKLVIKEAQYNELVNFEFTYRTKATKRKLKDAEEVDEIEPEDATEQLVADNYNVEKIITAINAYLTYQDEPVASHLIMLKDLYHQCTLSAHRMLKKGNEVDFKTKMEIKEYADKLMKDIKLWEEELARKNVNQKPLREEVKEVERKIFGSIRPELVAH